MAASGLCRVWGLAMALIVRCTSAWEMHQWVRGGVGISASGLQRAALCCSLGPGPDGRDMGGVSGSSGSGAEHPAPRLQGPPQKSPQAPGSPPLLSESCVHSTCVRASFGFLFLSLTVVPKFANPRNLREADTDANTRGFIYHLELVSKCTQHAEHGLGP